MAGFSACRERGVRHIMACALVHVLRPPVKFLSRTLRLISTFHGGWIVSAQNRMLNEISDQHGGRDGNPPPQGLISGIPWTLWHDSRSQFQATIAILWPSRCQQSLTKVGTPRKCEPQTS